ncbi:hypothetical protein ACTMU2_12660 [Cupriavidus basilensis]
MAHDDAHPASRRAWLTTCPSPSSTCTRRTRTAVRRGRGQARARVDALGRDGGTRAAWRRHSARQRVRADHWNGQFSSDARRRLVNPVVDPVSGEPEFKHTPVSVEPFGVNWHGFVLSRGELPADTLTYWTRVRGQRFQRYEIRRSGSHCRPRRLGTHAARRDWTRMRTGSNMRTAAPAAYHAGHVVNDRLEACVYSCHPPGPAIALVAG